MTLAVEMLAKIGYEHLRGAQAPAEERSSADDASDNARVAERLRESRASEIQGRAGAKWIRMITWPDRVPGLVTWSGQQTLAKTINKLRSALPREPFDPLTLQVPMQGASGLDPQSCPDPIDVGFSPRAHDMDIAMRPGLELLAILGAELVPLVSFGLRDCGFLHRGTLWRFAIETRAGADAYYHRWGYVRTDDPSR